jgi:uncharacterized protein (TIGR04222 family)
MIDAPTDDFAVFYLLLVGGALVVANIIQFIVPRISDGSTFSDSPLDVSQIAYLAGGRRRIIHSALASLGQRDAIRVVGQLIERKGSGVPSNTTPLENDIINVLANSPLTPRKIYRRCEIKIDEERLRLEVERSGLGVTKARQLQISIVAGAVAALPTIAGIIRLLHRLPQHRPVVFLGVLCLIPLTCGFVVAAIPIRSNRNGILLLKSLRLEEAKLSDIGYRKSLALSPVDVSRAVAIFGMRALRDSHLSRLAHLIDPPSTSSGGNGGDSDSGHFGGGHFSGGDFGGSLGDAF